MNHQTRQIGFDQTTALKNLDEVVREWIIPFLDAWVNSGPQPLASKEDIQRVQEFIQTLAASRETPEGYSWLPDLLARLAGAVRFNARNFVNIHPTPLIPAIVAALVASIQNPNNIVREVSEATTTFEEESIQWMSEELVGFDPAKSWGNVVSGGTIANMTALMVARDYSYRKLSRPRPSDVRTRGLFGLPAGVVLATAGSHYSIKKAMWFLGMGDENVVRIPVAFDEEVARRVPQDQNFVAGITDRYWRKLIETSTTADRDRGHEELSKFYAGAQEPFSLQPLDSEVFKALYSCFEYGTPLIAYVFTLGTTDTGTIERPNHQAIRRLVKEDVFIHADAALGGFALKHPRVHKLISELEKVHSVTIDGHKLGHLAYPNGAILFRDVAWRQEIMHEAPYLRDLAPTLEGSRGGGSSAALWAAIQDLGKNGGYVSWLDRLFSFVDRLKECVAAEGSFQVLHEVHLNTLAMAPVLQPGETRSEVNAIVERLHRAIASDTSADAFLVNIDRGLAGIKVRNSNRFLPVEESGGKSHDELVDIYCLRLVAANPAVEPVDADRLLGYLTGKLDEVRQAVALQGLTVHAKARDREEVTRTVHAAQATNATFVRTATNSISDRRVGWSNANIVVKIADQLLGSFVRELELRFEPFAKARGQWFTNFLGATPHVVGKSSCRYWFWAQILRPGESPKNFYHFVIDCDIDKCNFKYGYVNSDHGFDPPGDPVFTIELEDQALFMRRVRASLRRRGLLLPG